MFAQPQRALFVATPLYRYLCLPLQAFASKQTTTTGGGAPKFRGFVSSLGRFIYRDTLSAYRRFGFLFSLSANPLLIHGHIVAAGAIFSFLRQPLHPAAAANATNMGTVKKTFDLTFLSEQFSKLGDGSPPCLSQYAANLTKFSAFS